VKHYSEEDLILHYYDEAGRWTTAAGRRQRRSEIEQHVDQCPACAKLYRSLVGTLRLLEPPDGPDRGDQYGLEVWQRIRARLPEPEAPWWAQWLRWNRLAAAAGVAVMVVAAFVAGRWFSTGSTADNPPPIASLPAPSTSAQAAPATDGRQSILLTSVADHLDRSERVLTDIMNTTNGDISTEQQWAADLVSASRLYRYEAIDIGEQSVAGVLDELERNLLEVVHSPSRITAAQLDDVRRRIDAAALLFKVRVLGDELRQRELAMPSAAPHARAVTSQIS
jgi:hypothetical protein